MAAFCLLVPGLLSCLLSLFLHHTGLLYVLELSHPVFSPNSVPSVGKKISILLVYYLLLSQNAQVWMLYKERRFI